MNFHFTSNLFYLFFYRFPKRKPSFDRHPSRLITEVQINLWGKMMPKRGQLEYLGKISTDALGILVSEIEHMFFMLSCPYMEMDWHQYPNILFIHDDSTNERGNITVFFKII